MPDLQKMGCEKPVLRMGKMKAGPVVTDNGFVPPLPTSALSTDLYHYCSNFLIDAVFSESYMRDPSELLHRIKMSVISLSDSPPKD